MRYEAKGNEVHLIIRPPEYEESTIVATCFNEAWADVIAGLLQADWDHDHIASGAKAKVLHDHG